MAGLLIGVVYGIKASGQPAATDSPTTPEAAARTALQAQLDAYAAGDYGAAWDLWSDSGKKAISRADYLKWKAACKDKLVTGPKFEIKTLRIEDGIAIATVERLGIAFTYRLRQEANSWRFIPDDDAMAEYAQGVDALVASCKK